MTWMKVNKVRGIFTDENESWKFDFSTALWATDQLHAVYTTIKDSILHDVDFIVEEEQSLLFIECKNANFKDAQYPNSFHPIKSDSIQNVARKYYDSIHFVKGIGKNQDKKLIYIYIVESRSGSVTERKGIRNRLKDRLPFKLQKKYEFQERMIDDVHVLNIEEWNQKYPQYPASRIQAARWNI